MTVLPNHTSFTWNCLSNLQITLTAYLQEATIVSMTQNDCSGFKWGRTRSISTQEATIVRLTAVILNGGHTQAKTTEFSRWSSLFYKLLQIPVYVAKEGAEVSTEHCREHVMASVCQVDSSRPSSGLLISETPRENKV